MNKKKNNDDDDDDTKFVNSRLTIFSCGELTAGMNLLGICDPLWEKVHFRAIIEFLLRAEIRKNSTVLAKLLFVTSENYGVASAFSRWSGVDSPLLALAASFRSCGRRLRMYCVIEIPRAIFRNNARGSTYTFTRIVRGGKGLRTCGFRHRIQRALRFRTICVTQFRIFARKCTFSQSGSHMYS